MNETAEPAVVVSDANVLYSIVMTDLIISLGSQKRLVILTYDLRHFRKKLCAPLELTLTPRIPDRYQTRKKSLVRSK